MYTREFLETLAAKRRGKWFVLGRKEGCSRTLAKTFGFPLGTDRSPHSDTVQATAHGLLCERQPNQQSRSSHGGYRFRLIPVIEVPPMLPKDETPRVTVADRGTPMIQHDLRELVMAAIDRRLGDTRADLVRIVESAIVDAAKWGGEHATQNMKRSQSEAYKRGFAAGKSEALSALEPLRALLSGVQA